MRDFGSSLFSTQNDDIIVIRDSPRTIPITLTKDNVALEGTEQGTLRLVLLRDFTPPLGTFFRSDLNVIIRDTDSKLIGPMPKSKFCIYVTQKEKTERGIYN